MPTPTKRNLHEQASIVVDGRKLLSRAIAISAERVIDKDKRTVEIAVASNAPARQWFGIEVLEMSGCNLERMADACPLLWMHDLRAQIGVVEPGTARVDTDGVLRCVVRFSKNPKADEIFNDVNDGIIRNVSVGYTIDDYVEEKDAAGEVTFRVTKWTPYEVSMVSAPADTSVGVGRSANVEQTPKQKEESLPNKETRTMNPNEIDEMFAQAEKYGLPKEARAYQKTEGATIDGWRKLLIEKIGAKPAVEVTPPAAPAAERQHGEESVLGLSDKEARSYSIVRAIRCAAEGKELDGLEGEVQKAIRSKMDSARAAQLQKGSILIPADVTRATFSRANPEVAALLGKYRRALNAQTSTAGGALVAEELRTGDMISLLRNRTVIRELGARVLSDLVGDVSIPKQTAAAAAHWLAAGSQVPSSQQTIGSLRLSPKRLSASVPYDRQLIAQSSLDVEGFIREDLMNVFAIALDLAAIAGNGTSAPLGLLNTPDVNTVTFGAAPSWAKVVEFESDIETANALAGNLAYIGTPSVKGKFKTTEKASGYPVYLMNDEGMVNGYRFLATNQVPDNRVIFGDFSQIVLAMWAGMEIIVDPYTRARFGEIELTSNLWADVGIRQPKAFSVSTDAGNQ